MPCFSLLLVANDGHSHILQLRFTLERYLPWIAIQLLLVFPLQFTQFSLAISIVTALIEPNMQHAARILDSTADQFDVSRHETFSNIHTESNNTRACAKACKEDEVLGEVAVCLLDSLHCLLCQCSYFSSCHIIIPSLSFTL